MFIEKIPNKGLNSGYVEVVYSIFFFCLHDEEWPRIRINNVYCDFN